MSTVRLTCPCCSVVGPCDCNWAVPLAGRDFSLGFCTTCQKCPKHCSCPSPAVPDDSPVRFNVYLRYGHRINLTGTRDQLKEMIETLKAHPPDNDRVFFWAGGFFRFRDVIAVAGDDE